MNVLNAEVFDKQTASIFPSWTSRVRSPSPALFLSITYHLLVPRAARMQPIRQRERARMPARCAGIPAMLVAGWAIGLPVPFLLGWGPTWGWIVMANVLL